MITEAQQKWLDHLSDTDIVSVVAWDSTCDAKHLEIKNQLQAILGKQQAVEHRGASSLKISGQDEIDIYVPVAPENFDSTVDSVSSLYGRPRSLYPLKRARFVTSNVGKHIDVFVINYHDTGWQDSELFHRYLLTDPLTLEAYRKVKEDSAGKSVKAYYTTKIKFINSVLEKIKTI